MGDEMYFIRKGKRPHPEDLRLIKVPEGKIPLGERYQSSDGYAYDPKLAEIQKYIKANPKGNYFLRAEPIAENGWNFHLEIGITPNHLDEPSRRNPKRASLYFNDVSKLFEEDLSKFTPKADVGVQALTDITFDNDLSSIEIPPTYERKIVRDKHHDDLYFPPSKPFFKPPSPLTIAKCRQMPVPKVHRLEDGRHLKITANTTTIKKDLSRKEKLSPNRPSPIKITAEDMKIVLPTVPNSIPLEEEEDYEVPVIPQELISPKPVVAPPASSKSKKCPPVAIRPKVKEDASQIDLTKVLQESIAEEEKFYYYIGKTGKKRHRDEHCGRLKNPKKYSSTNPKVLSYTDCKVCC